MCHDVNGIPGVEVLQDVSTELHDALDHELAMCARRRNASLPINQLPPDVLRCIAALAPFNTRADAAFVCAHWRDALTSDQRLWRDPVFTWNGYGADRTSAAAVVRRAENRLVSLAVQSPMELVSDSFAVPLITSVLPHLRHLTVDLVPTDDGAWAHIFEQPAPALETLRVMRYALASVYVLPHTLFGGSAPNLRQVFLHCSVTPSAPCPAFSNVTTLGYFRFAKLTGGEVMNALTIAPKVERLIAGSWGYETASDYGGWTLSPEFKYLSVQKVISDGIFDALAHRAARVVVYEPLPLYADSLLLRCEPVASIAVLWIGASDRLTITLTDADGGEIVIARVKEAFMFAFIRRHMTRLRRVSRVVFPDNVWLDFCALPSPPAWPEATHLTLHLALSGQPDAHYTHMFVLQATPLESVLPKVETVHLVHAGSRGNAAGDYLRVAAEHVQRWLPASVRALQTSGIIFSTPGRDTLLSRVTYSDVPQPEEPYTLEDENEWEWAFPYEEALQL
ncbi:hypothetical protein AURDEDRAFT_117541 [Auricularia subglabra TFB-10046 SS5]|nr:hypothetical protein AURDEDRAFT_117541 [Auricularia subglabra TFB-10046 SS5]